MPNLYLNFVSDFSFYILIWVYVEGELIDIPGMNFSVTLFQMENSEIKFWYSGTDNARGYIQPLQELTYVMTTL